MASKELFAVAVLRRSATEYTGIKFRGNYDVRTNPDFSSAAVAYEKGTGKEKEIQDTASKTLVIKAAFPGVASVTTRPLDFKTEMANFEMARLCRAFVEIEPKEFEQTVREPLPAEIDYDFFEVPLRTPRAPMAIVRESEAGNKLREIRAAAK